MHLLSRIADEQEYLKEVAWGRCLTFYAVLSLLGAVAQCLVHRNVISRCHQAITLDFIATFVAYGCTMGHSFVGNVYGPLSSSSCRLVVDAGLIWILSGAANPLPHVMSLVTCSDRQQRELLSWRIGSNLLASLASHPLSKMLWIQLNVDINPKLLDRLHCVPSTDLPIGIGSEFVGTLIVCALFVNSNSCPYFAVYELAIKLLLDCFVQSLGLHHQGVNLNPAMAGPQSFGCGHQSDIMHGVIVHGFGPLAAAIVYVQYHCCQFSVPSSSPPEQSSKPRVEEQHYDRDQCCMQFGIGSPSNACCLPPKPACSPCGTLSLCNDKITAQVKQSKDEDGKRKVDYVVYFPPMCTEKGIRLRHKFVIDKDEFVDNKDEAAKNNSKKRTPQGEKESSKKSKESTKPREKFKYKQESSNGHLDSAAKKDKHNDHQHLDKPAATKKRSTASTLKNANKKSNHSDVSRSGSKTD